MGKSKEWNEWIGECRCVGSYLRQRTRKMITVIVHQMISIAAELVSYLLYDSPNFLFVEIRATYLYTLSADDIK